MARAKGHALPKPREPYPVNTLVDINIAQGLDVARGRVLESEFDEGWLYRVEVTAGSLCKTHRNDKGELWVCDFEATPVKERRSQ
jgi:hypothetical protein